MRHHENEVFTCLFVDSRHQIIQFEKLFYGSID
ncbi:JAB domain-containing protein [Coxiella-like endosymbiont]|nr:JAB domain-containing protein [Coxiella-like endosymbiont]